MPGRRANRTAFERAFLQVLLIPRESGLLRLGAVAIDGAKLDANASKIRSVRYDRAKELRAKLAADIAELTARAEAADAQAQPDPQALPAEIARREALAAKLDAACARLEEQARTEAEAARPELRPTRRLTRRRMVAGAAARPSRPRLAAWPSTQPSRHQPTQTQQAVERDAFTFVHASRSNPLPDRVVQASGAFAPAVITLWSRSRSGGITWSSEHACGNKNLETLP